MNPACRPPPRAVGVPQGDQVKPLTTDQKTLNAVFLRELARIWRAARATVLEKTAALSLKLLEAAAGRSESKGAEDAGDGAGQPSAEELRLRALQVLGVNKLHKWAETDTDNVEQGVKEEATAKREQASRQFEAYLRHKRDLEIVLPKREQAAVRKSLEPPPFIFSAKNPPLRQKKVKVVNTTVDMMWDSGMRVVHALTAGGTGSDLHKSRTKLLEDYQFVHQRNFEDQAEYEDWKASRRALVKGERVGVARSAHRALRENVVGVPELISSAVPAGPRGEALVPGLVHEEPDGAEVTVLVYGHDEPFTLVRGDVVALNDAQKRRVAASIAYR